MQEHNDLPFKAKSDLNFDVLKLIAKKMDAAGIKWMVFGSCSLALNGMPIQPDDIDILTDKDGFSKINQALIAYKIELPQITPSEFIDSIMSEFSVNGCSVDVMYNFKVKSRTNGQWHGTTHLLEHPNIIDLDNHKIPVLSLTKPIELYGLMGRDKDLAKIEKIEGYFRQVKIKMNS